MQPDYNNDFDFQSKLRALVSGELPTEDRAALMETLQQSTAATDEAVFSQKLVYALKHQDLLAANAFIGAVIAQEEATDPLLSGAPKSKPKWRFWLLSLTLAALLGVAFYGAVVAGWLDFSTTSRLANEYLTPLENVLITTDSRNTFAELDQGMAAYDQQNYKLAIALLGSYYRRTADVNAGLFLGVSHLMSGNAPAAAAVLETCAAQADYPALEAIQWYWALAYLKEGQTDRARNLLNSIPADGIYGAQALQLLNELPQ